MLADGITGAKIRAERKRGTSVITLAAYAGIVSLVLTGCAGASDSGTSANLDKIVRGGTVFDGTGSDGRIADVGIVDGKIVAVGDLDEAKADHVIDATGLYVSPGFIDVHSHTDVEVLGKAKSSLSQGVTTETLGPDGRGRSDIAVQANEIAGRDISINVAPYIGFNVVWESVVGEADVRPSDDQVKEMQGLFEQAMGEGAWGISSGLGYFPARYSTTDEVVRSLGDVGRWRTMFSDHMRDETDFVIESVEENISIGEQTGLMAEATHMKVAGPLNWGESAELLALQQGARDSGHPAGGDVYPYTAASTGLDFYVAGWAQDGGTEAMLQRFENPVDRKRIDQEVSDFVRADVGEPKNIYFPSLENKTLEDLMNEYGKVTIGEAVMRVLTEQNGDLPCVMMIGSEGDLEAFLSDPYVAISSDGGATDSTEVHPRHYGTFPRFLGKYVRDEQVVTWGEGIRKLTGLPATMLGMVDRGFLAPGMAADITVFDPESIIDKAEFGDPQQYSEGVELVLVNGELAFEAGESTEAHSGQILLRSSSMPNRAQNVGEDQAVSLEGSVAGANFGDSGATLKLDLEQSAQSASAAGTLSLIKSDGTELIDVRRLGLLQSAPGWWTISGVAAHPEGNDQAFVVIVDEQDPRAKAGETTVTVILGGEDPQQGVLTKG